jgi:acyl-CoA synthetase (AMP-forming)/AMP-acid ligase II
MTDLPGPDRLAPGALEAWRQHLGEEVDPEALRRNLSKGTLPQAFHEVAARDPERWGEEVVAFVVPEGEAIDPEALAAHVREHLSTYKCPKRFIEIEELPRNKMGKVQREELVRMASEEARVGPS